MRFADAIPHMDAFIAAQKAKDDARREDPLTLQRERLQAETRRQYLFGQDVNGRAGWQINFDAYACRETMRRAPELTVDVAVGSELRLSSDYSNWIPSLTVANLEIATAIARHVVAWVKGEVDELAPSGPWTPAIAVPTPAIAADRPMLLTIGDSQYVVPVGCSLHVASDGQVTITKTEA